MRRGHTLSPLGYLFGLKYNWSHIFEYIFVIFAGLWYEECAKKYILVTVKVNGNLKINTGSSKWQSIKIKNLYF